MRKLRKLTAVLEDRNEGIEYFATEVIIDPNVDPDSLTLRIDIQEGFIHKEEEH